MLNSQQDLAADAAEAAAAAHQARPARPPRRRHTIVNQLRQHVNTFITPGEMCYIIAAYLEQISAEVMQLSIRWTR